jgi:para-nitrobenzyl esterase
MQGRIFGDMMFRNSGVSEDCLYLNVWVPPTAKAGENLPVLVYYYGGGFVAGDGSEPRYDGESMAKRGIVVVTTSYRLGIFGFFSHPELTAESPNHASGNYSLMDQAAALKWVAANISRFGGNPKHVTIAGESAGSFAVSAQMASPMARDLIAGAIGESGAFFSTTIATPTRDSTEKLGVKFAQAVGAGNLAALRALSATELLEMSGRPGAVRFGPNVDGYFFPDVPSNIFAAGKQSKVPLLAGWNSEEMNSRAILQETPNAENMKALYARLFPNRADEAAKVFPASTPEEAQQSATDLASDRFIGFSTWKWLDVHAKTSGKPVYRYLYARPRPPTVEAGVTPNLAGGVTRGGNAPPQPQARGAVHSAEIEYAMGNLATNKVFKWSDEDRKVSQTMQGYFENFIKTGNPNGAGLPNWPVGAPDANGQVSRIRIDVDTHAEAEPRARYLFQDAVFTEMKP